MDIKRGKTKTEGEGGTLDSRGISRGRGIIKGREWTDDRWSEYTREYKRI